MEQKNSSTVCGSSTSVQTAPSKIPMESLQPGEEKESLVFGIVTTPRAYLTNHLLVCVTENIEG